MFCPALDCLQGADRAGTKRSGAGVTVQHRKADHLARSREDLTSRKARCIAVHKCCRCQLDQQTEPFMQPGSVFGLYPIPMHSRHILTAFANTSRCSPRSTPRRTNIIPMLNAAILKSRVSFLSRPVMRSAPFPSLPEPC